MDARTLTRSRAEILFAELLVEDTSPSASRVQDLCAAHPELAPEIERLHSQLAAMRKLLPDWAAPAASDSKSSSAAPPDLGTFRCLRLLGRGGMGEVWEAEDRTLGRSVAIKLLRDSWLASTTQDQRFQREAQAAGRVPHPGIVAVYQTGEWQGRRYIVQELVPGGRTVREEIEELRRLPELPADHARRVGLRFEKLTSALVAAHAAGIVHRDIKPQNVLLTPAGDPKVADFGLALLANDASLSRTGEFLGTYFYASPEQIEGEGRAADARSDIFSVGATLYENLTLSRAFEGDSVREISRAVMLSDPPAPHLVRGRIPRDLSLVCMKALEKRPEDRYASMAELHDDLARFLAHEPIRARAPSPARRALKWALRHPTMATALALSLGASLALTALYVRSEGLRHQVSSTNETLTTTAENLRVKSASLEEALRFFVGMFERAAPEISGDRVPSIREVIDTAVARIESGEVKDKMVRAHLLETLGSVSSNLGEPPLARRLLESALATWNELGPAHEAHAASTALSLCALLVLVGDPTGAEECIAPFVARLGRDTAFDAEYGASILAAHGEQLSAAGRYEEAEAAFDGADRMYEAHPVASVDPIRLRAKRAESYWDQGRFDETLEIYRTIVDSNPDLLARADPRVLSAANGMGLVLCEQKKLDEAERIFLEVIEGAGRSLDADHPNLLIARNNLARVWEAMGRYEDAEGAYRDIIAALTARFGPDDRFVLRFENNLGTCVVLQGRAEEAEAIHREVWTKRRQHFPDGEDDILQSQNNLAYALYRLGRLDEALVLQEEVVARTPESDPTLISKRRDLLKSIQDGRGAPSR